MAHPGGGQGCPGRGVRERGVGKRRLDALGHGERAVPHRRALDRPVRPAFAPGQPRGVRAREEFGTNIEPIALAQDWDHWSARIARGEPVRVSEEAVR